MPEFGTFAGRSARVEGASVARTGRMLAGGSSRRRGVPEIDTTRWVAEVCVEFGYVVYLNSTRLLGR